MAESDGSLVRRALRGEQEAFGVLVARYAVLVRGAVLERVRHREDAEDLVQEVFCRAYQQLPRLRRASRFAPWLAQIARRQALGWLRREALRCRVEPEGRQAPALRPDERLEAGEREAAVWDALDRLAPEERRLLVLYHLEGCTLRQIARFTGRPLATVRWRLLRAERRMGRELLLRLGRRASAAERQRLRDKVLASLPLLVGWEEARALGWMPLEQRVVFWSLVASLVVHLVGVGLWQRLHTEEERPVLARGALEGGHFAARGGGISPPPAAPIERLGPPAAPELEEGEEHPMASVRPAPGAEPSPVGALASPLPEKAWALPEILPELAQRALRDSLGSRELDLLRLEDLERSGASRAAIFTDLEGRLVRGFAHFTALRLYGAGSFSAPGNALADLARFLRDHTPIQARMRNASRIDYFLAGDLLEYPIHFVLEGGGLYAYRADWRTHLSEEEVGRLGAYLRGGGFLYMEGSGLFLREMARQVRRGLAGDGRMVQVPFSHPLYHAYYDFAGGFPGERGKRLADVPASDWYYAAEYDPHPADRPHGLWGVELGGEVVALLSDLGLLRYWEPDIPGGEGPQEGGPVKSPRLRAAANIVIYALTRPGSLASRQVRPLWMELVQGGSSAR